MVLKKLSQGMIVYDVRKSTGLHIFNGKWSTYPISIIEIDVENEKVLASWNYNKPQWFLKREWSKWRLKKPV